MGWGIDRAKRDELFGSYYVKSKKNTYDAVVVDMCSQSRLIASGPRVCTARQLCLGMVRHLFSFTKGLLILLFDDNRNAHPERIALHSRRYAKLSDAKTASAIAKGRVVVNGQAFSRGMEPYTDEEISCFTDLTPIQFSRLWSSSAGKHKAWILLQKGILWAHHQLADETRQLIMWHEDTPTIWPYNDDYLLQLSQVVCNNTFGEADQRVVEAIQVLSLNQYQKILIKTIDTDMILQLMCTYTVHGLKQIHLQLKNELIDMLQAINFCGNDASCRMSCAFF